jgi:hypothetical protein
MRTAMFTIERRTEMFRKLTTLLPLTILLGAVSAAPALAKTHSHHVMNRHGQIMVSPYASGADAYGSVIPAGYAAQPSQVGHRSLGETPALPFTQDPDAPRG